LVPFGKSIIEFAVGSIVDNTEPRVCGKEPALYNQFVYIHSGLLGVAKQWIFRNITISCTFSIRSLTSASLHSTAIKVFVWQQLMIALQA